MPDDPKDGVVEPSTAPGARKPAYDVPFVSPKNDEEKKANEEVEQKRKEAEDQK